MPVIDEIRQGNWASALSEFRSALESALDEWEQNGPWQAADEQLRRDNYKLEEELATVRKQLAATQEELRALREALGKLAGAFRSA